MSAMRLPCRPKTPTGLRTTRRIFSSGVRPSSSKTNERPHGEVDTLKVGELAGHSLDVFIKDLWKGQTLFSSLADPGDSFLGFSLLPCGGLRLLFGREPSSTSALEAQTRVSPGDALPASPTERSELAQHLEDVTQDPQQADGEASLPATPLALTGSSQLADLNIAIAEAAH